MNTTLPNIFHTYRQVINIINSCTTRLHLDSCRRLIKLFRNQYAYSLHTELLVKNLYVKHRIQSDKI